MKEALLKKRYGIPAALLLILLLSGTALAWYSFNTISTTTKVQEPLSTKHEGEFSETMYPGETNFWSFDIVNSADVAYSVKADLTYSAPDGVSITCFRIENSQNGARLFIETGNIEDGYSAEFDIPAETTVTCNVEIKAAKDATPGSVKVSLNLSRG